MPAPSVPDDVLRGSLPFELCSAHPRLLPYLTSICCLPSHWPTPVSSPSLPHLCTGALPSVPPSSALPWLPRCVPPADRHMTVTRSQLRQSPPPAPAHSLCTLSCRAWETGVDSDGQTFPPGEATNSALGRSAVSHFYHVLDSLFHIEMFKDPSFVNQVETNCQNKGSHIC